MYYFTENQEYLQVTILTVEQSRSLNQFQRIEYQQISFSDPNAIKLENAN